MTKTSAGCIRSCQRINRKSFCLYEAESTEAIRRAAVRAGPPADVIVEVAGRVTPDGFMHPVAG